MKFANHAGRLTLLAPDTNDALIDARGTDLHDASGGRLPWQPELALERWDEVTGWAADYAGQAPVQIDTARLDAPSPRPRQIFGIGINYADHGAEAGMERPEVPLVFTKLGPSVSGPLATVELSSESVDWEVELVLIISRTARNVPADRAWEVVAGITAGQDLSDRDIQWRPKGSPQFGLGKSLPGFAPTGPLLVTTDEFEDPDDVELRCSLNGDEVQHSRSSLMLFSAGELIAYLSAITTLLPGDLIFTGTPSGIGMARQPPRYLKPGDELTSYVKGVGAMSQRFAARSTPATVVGLQRDELAL